ncbi:MAG: site-2 protease family protein [Desulfuromonadales bacterium]
MEEGHDSPIADVFKVLAREVRMNGKRLTLFRLFGFTVYVDASWIFIAILVTWSLAIGYFPARVADLSAAVYWTMGVLGALGLFASIIFHEFSHSLVARHYGLPMRGITLFLFGGVSEMSEEPENAKTEFLMAVAGPVSSILLGFVFYFVYRLGQGADWSAAVGGVIGYLAFINWVLAGFNLLPAFPLDGGRMLRSALWHWRGDLRWATGKAAFFGSGFGIVLIALGVVSVLTGNLVGGFWYVIIGLFLRNAAQMSYQQVVMRQMLGDERVRARMSTEPVTVPPSRTVRELVENYIYTYHFKFFPIVEDGRLVGCISTRGIKEIPKEEWDVKSVAAVAEPCSPESVVSPDLQVQQALNIMNRTGRSRLMVVENDVLVGVIALKDVMKVLALRMDLEGARR